jgi:hypothetical protein
MRALVIIAAAGAAVSLGACAPWFGLTEAGPAMPGALEPVHAAAVAKDQAVFWVSSNGCTDKGDLTPVVRRAGDQSVITLRRLHEDRCEHPVTDGVEVRWSFEEMGLPSGARVSIDNPYQMPAA